MRARRVALSRNRAAISAPSSGGAVVGLGVDIGICSPN
jgi:hypothetical protein